MVPVSQSAEKDRLDAMLVRLGHYATRSRARDAVLRGTVTIDGKPARKPGEAVRADAVIGIADDAGRYVSRAALKLASALDLFGFDPAGAMALDVGASTGGFTQVLLERGAGRVHAVDVGHSQLDPKIAGDPRVVPKEGLNARDLGIEDLGGVRPDFLVCDVSFISLRLAMAPALDLAAPGAKAVLLVKPQFEAGREAIGKGGLLKDPARGPAIAEELRRWLDGLPGWRAVGLADSPISGGDGNREFLLAGVKDR